MSMLDEILRVIVVDDEKIIADTMDMILSSHGYDCRVSYSAEEAVITAEEFQPDAVISDVIMGVMSGIDLAIYLAEKQPQCKVLLISGQAVALELMEQANRHGYYKSILSKPIHPDQILAFLASCASKG